MVWPSYAPPVGGVISHIGIVSKSPKDSGIDVHVLSKTPFHQANCTRVGFSH